MKCPKTGIQCFSPKYCADGCKALPSPTKKMALFERGAGRSLCKMKKVRIERDPGYAPCGFLIVQDGFSTRDDGHTRLVDSDWDFPSLAANLGFVPCKCGMTDGTIPCKHKEVSEMIFAAEKFLDKHLGRRFEDPGYFNNAV